MRQPISFVHAAERRSLRHRHEELATEVRGMAEAALGNEEMTRRRVAALEERVSDWTAKGFWARLRWLALGR